MMIETCSIVPCIRHQTINIVMLLWQHSWFQSLSALSQMLPLFDTMRTKRQSGSKHTQYPYYVWSLQCQIMSGCCLQRPKPEGNAIPIAECIIVCLSLSTLLVPSSSYINPIFSTMLLISGTCIFPGFIENHT